MGKYEHDAREMLKLVGGRENIVAVTHCMTRMRFALADPSKADVPAIEALPDVKGSFSQAGQFQIISFYAKKARGMMARHIIKHRLTRVDQLTGFNADGYYFVPEESDANTLMFKRAEN